MDLQHFGLRHPPLGKEATELWDDGALAQLAERFQWLLHSPGVGLLTGDAGLGKPAALRPLTPNEWRTGGPRPGGAPPQFAVVITWSFCSHHDSHSNEGVHMKPIDPKALFRLSVLGPLVSRERLERGELQPVSYTHLDVYKRQLLNW